MAEPKVDYWSQLPRDCRLAVLSLVDKDTLDEMERVNKVTREVVNDSSLSRIKRTGVLHIYEQRSGHSFVFKVDKTNECLRYHIGRAKRMNPAKGTRSKEPMERTRETNVFGLLKREEIEEATSTIVPDQVYENLRDLLNKHAPRFTYFEHIRVDDNFIDQFSIAMEGSKGNRFNFNGAMFDDALDTAKFAAFLRSMNLRKLVLDITNNRCQPADYAGFARIFDAKFLRDLAEATPIDSKCLPFFVVHLKDTLYHWVATKDHIPTLGRYRLLMNAQIKVDPETFLELILIHMNAGNWKGYKFSLTRELTYDDLLKIDSNAYHVDRIGRTHRGPLYGIQTTDGTTECQLSVMRLDSGDFTVAGNIRKYGDRDEENSPNRGEGQVA